MDVHAEGAECTEVALVSGLVRLEQRGKGRGR